MATNVYSLETLREDAERKFAPISIALKDGTEVVLSNVMRLGKTHRKEVLALLKSGKEKAEDDAADDTLDNMLRVIELVAKETPKGKRLVREIGDDLAVASSIIGYWAEATQLGEAENSDV